MAKASWSVSSCAWVDAKARQQRASQAVRMCVDTFIGEQTDEDHTFAKCKCKSRQHVPTCDSPKPKFNSTDNSKRKVQLWLYWRLRLGPQFPVGDDLLISSWKCLSSCDYGYKTSNGHHKRAALCINPVHCIESDYASLFQCLRASIAGLQVQSVDPILRELLTPLPLDTRDPREAFDALCTHIRENVDILPDDPALQASKCGNTMTFVMPKPAGRRNRGRPPRYRPAVREPRTHDLASPTSNGAGSDEGVESVCDSDDDEEEQQRDDNAHSHDVVMVDVAVCGPSSMSTVASATLCPPAPAPAPAPSPSPAPALRQAKRNRSASNISAGPSSRSKRPHRDMVAAAAVSPTPRRHACPPTPPDSGRSSTASPPRSAPWPAPGTFAYPAAAVQTVYLPPCVPTSSFATMDHFPAFAPTRTILPSPHTAPQRAVFTAASDLSMSMTRACHASMDADLYYPVQLLVPVQPAFPFDASPSCASFYDPDFCLPIFSGEDVAEVFLSLSPSTFF